MAITRQKKEELVESYLENLRNSHAVLLADYRGTTVQQLQKLRRQMRQHNTTVQVAKNTLLKRALRELNMPVPEDLLKGPTAVVYLPEDVATASKNFFDALKDLDKFVVKGAILETQVLDAEGAKGLRDLPSRATVLAQLLGAIQAPFGELLRILEAPAGELYRTIQAPLRELAMTVQAYADKQQAEPAA